MKLDIMTLVDEFYFKKKDGNTSILPSNCLLCVYVCVNDVMLLLLNRIVICENPFLLFIV